MTDPHPLRAFGDSAEALHARIADAEARGELVPPEARAMLASLRELSAAIADLQASLRPEAAPEAPAPDGQP